MGGVLVVEVVGAVQGDGGQDQVAVDDVVGPGHGGVGGVLEQRGVVGVVGVGGDDRLEDVDVLGQGPFPGLVPGRERPGTGGWLGVSEQGRMQYRPDLLDGFIAETGLITTPP